MGTMSLRLSDEVWQRLNRLADATGRTTTDCATEAICRYLDDTEDLNVAKDRWHELQEGRSKTIPLERDSGQESFDSVRRVVPASGTIEISDYTDSETSHSVVETIQFGLRKHNQSQHSDPNAGEIVLALHGAEQEVVAGLICDVAYGWLTVESLWVSANHRGQRLGSRLLAKGEQLGKARGCHGAHLTTYSFQAPAFYEHHGYERFGELQDYPGDESMVFLRKKL